MTGLERSGKTTLAAFLDSHPLIAIPPFGTNMWHLFGLRYGDLRIEDNLERCLREMAIYKGVAWLDPDLSSIKREFESSSGSYAELFSLFLRGYAEQKSKPIWGAQSAWVDRYADEVFGADLKSHVIHVVRDPRDRYAEVNAHWPNGRGQAGASVAKWNRAFHLAQRNLLRNKGRYLVVRFEDLVVSPIEVLRDVCESLGVEYDAMMLNAVKRNRHDIVRGTDTPPLIDTLSVDRLMARRWDLDEAEVDYIQFATRRGRRTYGYEPVTLSVGGLSLLTRRATSWPSQSIRLAAWRLSRGSALALGRRPPIDPRDVVSSVSVNDA